MPTKSFLALALVFLSNRVLYAGTIVGQLDVAGFSQADRMVVFVETVPAAKIKSSKQIARLSQRGQKFRPTVLPVVQHSQIDMTNDDFVVHNIYSNSETKRFNLEEQTAWQEGAKQPSPSDLPNPVLTFEKPGMVDLHCNIHPKMAGMVLVLQNPFFAKPDEEGKFQIANVPAGTYTVKLYEMDQPMKSATVTVKAKGSVKVSFGS